MNNLEIKPNDTTELLIEGIKSYPQALVAIREFRDALEALCRDVVRDNLALITDSMTMIPLDEIEPDSRPAKISECDGKWATVGVRMRVRNGGPIELGYSVEWNDGTPCLVASIQFSESETADLALATLKRGVPGIQAAVHKKQAYSWRDLTPSDVREMREKMVELIQEWSGAWRQVGGVMKVLEK